MRRVIRFPSGRFSGSARAAIEMVAAPTRRSSRPTGRRVATASEAGIMFFELATGRRTLWITDSGVPNGAGPNFSRFAFSPDGKKLFTPCPLRTIARAVAGTAGPYHRRVRC